MSNLQFPYGIDKIGMSYSEKDDEYRKRVLDYYCLIANDFSYDYERMRENYLLKNSRLPKEQYRYLCGTLGNNENTDMFIDMFNFTGNIIDSLKGEELGRPFPFSVVANSERINNRMERLKRDSINNIVETIFTIEIQKAVKLIELETSKMSKEEMQSRQGEIEEEFRIRFNNLPKIKDVFKKYSSISSIEEITMNKVMKSLYHKYNIKKIKNDCFGDVLLVAAEFVEAYFDVSGTLPKLKRLNPLYVFYQKSPDVEFIDEADFAGYKERISIAQAIENYGEYLDDEDYEELVYQGANSGILGTDQKFFSKGDNPDPWRSQRFGENGIGYGSSMNAANEWANVGHDEFGGEMYGNIPGKPNDYVGLHTTIQRRNMNRYIDKYVVYWKSTRKLGKLKYINEYGESDYTFVDEDFIVPRDAKKVKTVRDNLTKSLVEYVWLDARDNNMSLEWITVNEVWKGVRLGRKHIVVEPLVASYKSLLNPYEVRLPIFGVVINNSNAMALSKMDAMKPWQKLYFAMMAKLLKTIHLDRGEITLFNTMYLDSNFGLEKTLAIAEDQNLILYNPALSAKDGLSSLMNSSKIAEKLDMTNYKAATQYIDLLRFIEENIIKSAGMSPQRVAQSMNNSTATDNYRETQSSMNITEPLFYIHDILWERVMKGYMEMVLTVLSDDSGILRDFLNDEEKSVVDLKFVSLTDNYNLRVGNSGKQVRILEQTQQLVQALVQNDKINLSQFISLMKTEDLSEFQVELKEVEEMNNRRQEEMQKSQQEHEKEMEGMRIKVLEDGQINELEKAYLNQYMNYRTQYMKSVMDNQSFDAEKDYNKDGVPDYLQLAQMKEKLQIERDNVAVKAAAVENKAVKDQRELEIKEQESSIKYDTELIKSESDRLKEENKKEIEKIKSAARSLKSKS